MIIVVNFTFRQISVANKSANAAFSSIDQKLESAASSGRGGYHRAAAGRTADFHSFQSFLKLDELVWAQDGTLMKVIKKYESCYSGFPVLKLQIKVLFQ